MKNTPRKPYIYKVTNLETGQYYIGSQCSGKIIGMNYFTSSTNKAFKEGFKNYKEEKYKITIIKSFTDPKECVNVENYIIRNYMQKRDGLCLNRFYCCNGEKIFSAVGLHHSEETRKRISKGHKGLQAWNKGLPAWNKGLPSPKKGIPLPEEVRRKLSASLKGRPSTFKGSHHSNEARRKMSASHKGQSPWNKGIPLPEEVRRKMSEAHKRRIKISDTVFGSLTEASKYYNVSISAIRKWIKTGKHNAVYVEK